MRAVIINGDQLEIATVPAPMLQPTLRVAVKAVGINRADLLQRRALPWPPGFPQKYFGDRIR